MAATGPKKPTSGTISALPEDLIQAATAFLDLSNTCTFLVGSWVIQDGPQAVLLSVDPDNTDKPELKTAWDATLQEITGILLSGELAFLDAAADLSDVAKNFEKADE